MKIARKLIVFLLLLPIVFSSVGCGSSSKPEEDTRVVAVADGNYNISYDLYLYFYRNYLTAFSDKDFEDGNAAATEAKLREQCLSALKNVFGTVSACEAYGVTMEDPTVLEAAEIQIREAIESLGGESDYYDALKSNYMTDSVFRFMMQLEAAEDKLYNELLLRGVIDNSDETVMAAIKGKDFVRVVQVLIANNNGFSDEKNRETAEKVLALAKEGTDFDKLIANYSNDYSMTSDGYYFTYNYMLKEIEDAAFALEVGEISDIIETKNGYHILKRLPKEDSYMTKNYTTLKAQYESCRFYSIIDAASEKITIVGNELLDTISREALTEQK